MQVFPHDPATISDVLALISSPSLTLSANNAPRVAELQHLLRTVQPWDAVSRTEFGVVSDALDQRNKDSEVDGRTIERLNKDVRELTREREALGATVKAQAEALDAALRKLVELERAVIHARQEAGGCPGCGVPQGSKHLTGCSHDARPGEDRTLYATRDPRWGTLEGHGEEKRA